MVIDFGEAEVLERHVFETLDGVVGRHGAVAHFFEQGLQFARIHYLGAYRETGRSGLGEARNAWYSAVRVGRMPLAPLEQ